MSTKTSGTEVSNGKKELIADADPGSLSRAQEDVYEFALAGDRHVNVRNTSYDETGHVYTVAVEDGLPARCTCPAFEHHDGPCKHLLACVIRSPIMTALGSASESQRVAADGGTEVSASPEQPSPPPSKPSEEKPYTTHLEPVKQGGGTYARCTGCSREIIPVGRFDKLSHAADCPVGEEGE